jgi:endoglucanase
MEWCQPKDDQGNASPEADPQHRFAALNGAVDRLERQPGAAQVAGTNAWYASNLGTAKPATHFVIDTSRNGQGPWTPPAGVYPDPQDWCNPPGRGLGERPRARPASVAGPLLDAYLWVKTPGQSDGQCNRGIAGSTTDPEWGGIEDPAAGEWFPQRALGLARMADPPLR